MDVYLIRHAIAELRDATRWPDDSLRPLSDEGSERFRRAARGLSLVVPSVDLVLASPFVRSWQTAELLHDEAGWRAPERCPALAFGAPAAVLDVVRRRLDRASVALVGHEPNLSSLASLLLAGDENSVALDMKKGGTALLEVEIPLAPGSALLRWSVSPKILRALDSR